MAYKTKVEIQTNGKVYPKGSILPDNISKIDLDFLKKKKFIDLVEVDDALKPDFDSEDDGEDGEDNGDDLFGGVNPGEMKSEDEIRKIRTKKDAFDYASSIGLDLGDDYEGKKLSDLIDEILNFQEEGKADGE